MNNSDICQLSARRTSA